MVKKFLIYLIPLILISCSSYERNSISKGEVVFNNGKTGDKSWESKLKFKRYSLYSDFNLSYELLVSKIDSTSDFYNWFTIDEKNELAKCESKPMLFINFSGPGGLRHSEFEEQLEKQAYKKMLISGFHKNIQKHPSYRDYNLGRYQMLAACGGQPLEITAYGFKKILIK